MTLTEWAERWGLPPQALLELACNVPEFVPEPPSRPVVTEAGVQSLVRLEAPAYGVRLFRNNRGAFQDDTGGWVRYGLANDSKPVGDALKSADLIGWRRRLIKSDDVGKVFAQFVSREIKRPGWKYTGTPLELAQVAWHTLVLTDGGDSAIINAEGSFK